MRSADVPQIAHDPDVLEAFYREHVETVQRFVVRRISDPHLVADLTAEVFLAAIDAAPGYRPRRGVPVAWLLGIARNVIAAEHRRAGRERRANARFQGRELLGPDDLARMQERIDAAAEVRGLADALDRLPPSERAVLELAADGPAQLAQQSVFEGIGHGHASIDRVVVGIGSEIRCASRRRARCRRTRAVAGRMLDDLGPAEIATVLGELRAAGIAAVVDYQPTDCPRPTPPSSHERSTERPAVTLAERATIEVTRTSAEDARPARRIPPEGIRMTGRGPGNRRGPDREGRGARRRNRRPRRRPDRRRRRDARLRPRPAAGRRAGLHHHQRRRAGLADGGDREHAPPPRPRPARRPSSAE